MPSVRIQHIASATTTVVVQRHRQDIPPGEPASLIAEDRLPPGHAVVVPLQPGEVVTVHEAVP